jgi:hypothetical protein
MVFSLIASYLGEKERMGNFFHVVLIYPGLGQDLTHLAHKENTHNEIFLQAKKFIAFCSLTALSLGTLSEYAERSQSSPKLNFF